MPTRTQSKNRDYAQGVVVKSANNMPVSSVLRIEGTHKLITETTETLADYSSPTVTFPNSANLNLIRTVKRRYTGNFILITADNEHFFIDRASIDSNAKTADLYIDAELTESPTSIDLSEGWELAEAKLVNYLSTSSQAHIDEVNFRGFDVQFTLDAKTDSVAVKDSDGDQLDVLPDGSVDVNTVTNADDGDTIAVARHAVPFEDVDEFNRISSFLDANNFTEVYSHLSQSDDLRIKQVKATTSTLGEWRLKIDGTTKDIYRTSNTERNALFSFYNEVDLKQGQQLTVEFRPERNRLSSYNFLVRVEGYENQAV